MEWFLLRRTSFWGRKSAFWLFLLYIAGAKGEMHHSHYTTMIASPPHLYYTCPEGATAKMVCSQKGTLLDSNDAVRSIWLFTPHSDQHCVSVVDPRSHSHRNRTLPPEVQFGHSKHDHWVILHNVRTADQGRYCCVIREEKLDHKHSQVVQRSFSHVVLQVIPRRNGTVDCAVWDPTPSGGTVPVALAITACIVALLSLPLILVLVYKQRENYQSRRGQELVRIDSETQGHENPVFLGGSPETKTRTVSQIMTRQSSETGRHLLSEPGTPFSPPAHGDVFFPAEDTIPESPDILQV